MATVLIVDDDAALRESLAETLTDLGHTARLASSGRDGLAALSDEIDAVLLDLRMPGGTRRYRRSPPYSLTARRAAGRSADRVCERRKHHRSHAAGRLRSSDQADRTGRAEGSARSAAAANSNANGR